MTKPTRQYSPAQALAEFKVACDIWLAKMDMPEKEKALEYAHNKIVGEMLGDPK